MAKLHADDAAGRFVEAAYASALFQARISSIAAAKDPRPGIKVLAERVRDFRTAQLPELARLAATAGVEVRDTLDLELRSIVENIEPLDYLALSRRYAEVETQALGREIAAYEDATRSEAQPVREYAAATLERLRDLSKAARAELAAVAP
ncbi:DUF4142 domain-containing protein [Methylobacterium radiodurans]|uniref:DUF4142 domain-containing protein n=1 Tax=Methylobacterium radiodurans TaxID=2202828 RepID=UPI001FEB580E|nr:DUF4142 domain-containing protein [Methylobacterium radiodurans]